LYNEKCARILQQSFIPSTQEHLFYIKNIHIHEIQSRALGISFSADPNYKIQICNQL